MDAKAHPCPPFDDSTLEGLYLINKMSENTITARELIRLSFLREMISPEEYEEAQSIIKDVEAAEADED